MSQKTLNLCLERYNFVKFGETTKSSHTVLCINNAYSVNSDKYRLTPTTIVSKHGEGYVFTLNYDFDRPLFTIVQKSYTLDGTSGNIVFEGIDPISKGGSKYLRKVTVSPVKLSDGSYLLEVTKDEYLRIGTTGAALGDEELESLNEKIVATGGIEKSVETVGGKQVLKLDASGSAGAKEIVYFDVDPSDPPSGIYDAIGEALSNNKIPVIKIDGAMYFYTATGTDKYVFVGGYTKEAVGYTEIEVSDDDSVTSKSVDDKVFNMYLLYKTDPASPGNPPGTEDYWICDVNKHVITKAELLAAHADCRYFILNNAIEPASNSRKYFASVTDITSSHVRLRFYMMQYSSEGVAEFYQKTVTDDSEGRLYVLSSYNATLAGVNHAVLVSEPQSFDSTQKAQGRTNIGAASASDVTALQSQVSSLSDVSAYSVKGEATVAQLNAGPSGIQAGWAYQLTDSGTLTNGSLAVVAGDTVAWDGTKWFPLVKSDYYATKTYAQNVAHSIAQPFIENTTTTIEGLPYMYNGSLYVAKETYKGVWDGSKFYSVDLAKFVGVVANALYFALNVIYTPTAGEPLNEVNIVDENNNILATIDENGINTKKFSTSYVTTAIQPPSRPSDVVDIVDESNNILATISKDGIKTENLKSCPDVRDDYSQECDKVLNITDERGNILATVDENGVRTLHYEDGGAAGSVNVKNGDCITILGSSFGQTTPFPANKHWSGIMSMFTDYRIQVLASGGSNVILNLYWLRKGTWNADGKYVLISNNENARVLSKAQLLEAFNNLCVTLKGMGKEPIIATNYHATQTQCSEFKTYAKQTGIMFWDCSNYAHSLVKGIYGGFDDGAHLRKRNAPLVAFGYLPHLLGMERPEQSLKVFRVRDEFSVSELDDLVFGSNFERAKKFKEILVSNDQSLDEYIKLKNKSAITFTDYALLSCVLPVNCEDLKKLAVKLGTSSTLDVYVKNTIVEPYPNPVGASSSGIRFSVSATINAPVAGDVYSVEGVDYLVRNVVMGENGYYCTIYCTPATLPAGVTGTMSRVSQVSSSTGDASISYALAEEITFDIYDFVTSDNQGHWVKLDQDNNGNYVVEDYAGAVNIDRVDFLVVGSGSFSLTDIDIVYAGSKPKHNYFRNERCWEQNDYIHTDEILPETTFGAVGTNTSFWVDDDNQPIESVANYETTASGSAVFPEGCSSELVIDDNTAMNCTLSSSMLDKFGDMILEIWCRYFPSAPTPYTQDTDTSVTGDSYDFNTLHVEGFFAGNTEYDVKFDFEVGLFWQIVRVPLVWFYQHYQNDSNKFTSLKLRLSAKGVGLEVCNVSLKYK